MRLLLASGAAQQLLRAVNASAPPPMQRNLSSAAVSSFGPHGPRAYEVWFHSHPPRALTLAFLLTVAAAVATLTINCGHLSRLDAMAHDIGRRRSRYSLRDAYTAVVRLASVFAFTSVLTVFAVRASLVWITLRRVYEAWALHNFLVCLIELMGGEEEALVLLSRQPKVNMLAVPPLCCIFKPCCSPRRMDAHLMSAAIAGTRQYIFVIPAAAFLRIYFLLDAPPYLGPALVVVRVVEAVSTLTALYCLFVTYWACKGVLHEVSPTRKFVTIKALLVVCAVQEAAISALLPLKADTLDARFDHASQCEVWAATLLSVECVGLALMMRSAFNASDESHLDLMTAAGKPGSDEDAISEHARLVQ